MTEFLTYLLKSGACIALFYLVYKYLLGKETFFGLNRVLISASVTASLLLPVLRVRIVSEVANYSVTTVQGALNLQGGEIVSAPVEVTLSPEEYLPLILFTIYIGGVIFFSARYLGGIIRILQIIGASKRLKSEAGLIYISSERIVPFNWFGIIVISAEDYESNGSVILEHERAHIYFGHDYDLLFFNIIAIFQWFNPFIWRLKSELSTLHEFQADNRVIKNGIDAKQYQYLLIALGTANSYSIPVVNNLCSGNFKQRIKMMLKKQSNPFRIIKAMILLPMLAGAVTLFAENVYVAIPPVSSESILKTDASPDIAPSDKISKDEAIEAVTEIYKKSAMNNGGIRTILKWTKNAKGNYSSFVYIAQMASEFGYHTLALSNIAKYASKARVETDYFKQIADLSVMKLSETTKIVNIAEEVAKLKTSTSPEIDKKIREIRESANFKNMEEAKQYNYKSLKALPTSNHLVKTLDSTITRFFFQNLIYPTEAKTTTLAGKFCVSVKVIKGEVKECRFNDNREAVKVPMLQEIVVVAYKPAGSSSSNSDIKSNAGIKAIEAELERVGKKLSELTSPEWKNYSGEFAIPVTFVIR